MNKKIGLIGVIIVIIGIITLIYLIYPTSVGSTSNNKVVIFAPHPDDETIGMGGLIQRLKSEGKEVHVVVMCSGNGISSKVPLCYNYYGLNIPANASPADRKKIIREDSFKRAVGIYGVSYEMIGLDDSGTTDENVFNVMDRMRKEGYGEFYTTTGEFEVDHLHCANAMKLMMEKYPQLKYRQYPVYWHASNNGPERFKPVPIVNNYTDYNVVEYLPLKLKALQVYNNIQIFPVGLYQANIERIYYLN
ncbi:MAG: PIG-L deacetylase family protein [Methanobacterium sp.]